MNTLALPVVRQSFAAAFSKCHLAAKLDRDGSDFDTHPQARGTVFHEFAAQVVRACVEAGSQTFRPDGAKALMADVIAESGKTIPPAEFDALMMLAWKFASEWSFDVEHIVDVEERYTAELEGVTLTGRPDYIAIDGRAAWVRDWKTSWATEGEQSIGESFQLRWYAYLVLKAFSQVHTVHVALDYPRWGVSREADVTREDMADVELFLRTTVRQILHAEETGEWPASPGSWCHVCPDPLQCPIPASERGEGALEGVEQAQAAAEYLLAAEEAVGRVKKALRAWCKESGHVRVGDLEWGFALTADSERVIDKEMLRSAFSANDIDWESYMKPVKGSSLFRARRVPDA